MGRSGSSSALGEFKYIKCASNQRPSQKLNTWTAVSLKMEKQNHL